jgi:hypothetical protein
MKRGWVGLALISTMAGCGEQALRAEAACRVEALAVVPLGPAAFSATLMLDHQGRSVVVADDLSRLGRVEMESLVAAYEVGREVPCFPALQGEEVFLTAQSSGGRPWRAVLVVCLLLAGLGLGGALRRRR